MIEQLIDLALAYPAIGWAAAAIFWAVGIVVILCLVAMLRRDQRGQVADDLEQMDAITRPAALEKPTHAVHIQPAADHIPWTRRMQPPGPERRQ